MLYLWLCRDWARFAMRKQARKGGTPAAAAGKAA
jgi:hypothetical protein